MATCTPAQLLIGTVIVHSTVLWEGKQRQQILMEVWADERKSVRNLYVYVSIKDRYMSLSCIGGAGGGGSFYMLGFILANLKISQQKINLSKVILTKTLPPPCFFLPQITLWISNTFSAAFHEVRDTSWLLIHCFTV